MRKSTKPVLATIGYEGASFADFLATLLSAGIKTLIDVREVTVSRRKGFSKHHLQEALESVGIRYVHLIGLGDPKPGREAARAGRFEDFTRIYATHLRTPNAQADLAQAAEIVATDAACLMCYERRPEACHRSFVADALTHLAGVEVKHLGVWHGLAAHDGKRTRACPDAGEGAPACRG